MSTPADGPQNTESSGACPYCGRRDDAEMEPCAFPDCPRRIWTLDELEREMRP